MMLHRLPAARILAKVDDLLHLHLILLIGFIYIFERRLSPFLPEHIIASARLVVGMLGPAFATLAIELMPCTVSVPPASPSW